MTSLNLLKSLYIITYMILHTCYTSFAVPTPRTSFKLATIAAEPAVLPYSPLPAPAPALSPDITPLFPTPGSGVGSGSTPDASLPVIPSSPSPPNPDTLGTPHPELSISPSGAMPMPESSAFALCLSVSLTSVMLVLGSFAPW